MDTSSTPSVSAGKYNQQLTILHGALLAGQVAFILAAVFLVQTGRMPKIDKVIPLPVIIVVAAIPLLAFAAARAVLAGRLKTIQDEPTEEKKLTAYKSALIFSWAVAEAGILPAIILFLITGSIYPLAMAGVGIVLFFLARPSRTRTGIDIGMSDW